MNRTYTERSVESIYSTIDMKIIICFIPMMLAKNRFGSLYMPPMAIYTLSAELKKANYSVVTVDPKEFYQFENEREITDACYKYLKSKISNEDIVCFSTNTFNWGLTRIISNKISENNPNQKIILGGLHTSVFDKHALEVTSATLVIRGEGEKKLLEVVEALINTKPITKINGVTYRKKDKIIRNPDEAILTLKEIEETSLPDFSSLPIEQKYNVIPIESSRGCKFSCAFCSIPHRYNWRGLSIESIKRRVNNLLMYKYFFAPKSRFVFVDDCFTADADRAITILNTTKSLIGDAKMFIEVRATDVVNSNLFNYVDRNDLFGMQIGVECGYDDGLRKIRKGLSMDLLYAALTKLCENGFRSKIQLSFIIGFPWEGLIEINKTLDTVEYIISKFKVICTINWLLLLPSDLWKDREKYGISVDESIYDDPLWLSDEHIFYNTHPLITVDLLLQIEDRFRNMVKKGLLFTFTSLPFRENNVRDIISEQKKLYKG